MDWTGLDMKLTFIHFVVFFLHKVMQICYKVLFAYCACTNQIWHLVSFEFHLV